MRLRVNKIHTLGKFFRKIYTGAGDGSAGEWRAQRATRRGTMNEMYAASMRGLNGPTSIVVQMPRCSMTPMRIAARRVHRWRSSSEKEISQKTVRYVSSVSEVSLISGSVNGNR